MLKVKQTKKKRERLQSLVDDELIQLIHQGHAQALELLMRRYKSFVLAKARTYFLIGGDREDITQEGMIGLYKAICDYNEDKLTSFRAFADLCITRQIITAIKTATRQKHIPLNSYISLNKPIYDDDSDRTLLDTIAESSVSDPQELLISQEKFGYMKLKLAEILSDFEQRVLILYLDGYSYQEISDELKKHVKSVDNALQRIKRKFEQLAEKNEFIFS